jgi:hypothetical protein
VHAVIGLALGLVLEVVRLVSLGPVEASIAAARILGAPGWTSEVLDLVKVESRGVAVSVHRQHARRVAGRRFWARAVRVGWLDPVTCPEHQLGDGDRHGIRGAHGLAAAYSVRYLGACVAPELLDVPIASAIVVVRRLEVLDREYKLHDRPARMRAWRRGIANTKPPTIMK